MPHAVRPLAALALVAALASACGGSDGASSQPSASVTPANPVHYVALGDSYTAAPGLPETDASSGSCARSSNDYPHLVAAVNPSIVLDDVSCSGATTDDVLSTQLAAVQPDTDVVTVGIGGNDEALFTTVVGGCTSLSSSDPTGSPCTDAFGSKLTGALTQVRANVDHVLTAIHDKAPSAHVIVVGYPQVLPDDGSSCPDLVPIASGDFPLVNRMNQGLSQALQAAAKAAGDDFVDVYGPSHGHDVCSSDPWINGVRTAPDGVIPFHPFGNEQHAVAGRIAQLLS